MPSKPQLADRALEIAPEFTRENVLENKVAWTERTVDKAYLEMKVFKELNDLDWQPLGKYMREWFGSILGPAPVNVKHYIDKDTQTDWFLDIDFIREFVAAAIRKGLKRGMKDQKNKDLFIKKELKKRLTKQLDDVISLQIHFKDKLNRSLLSDPNLEKAIDMELFLKYELNERLKEDADLEKALATELIFKQGITNRVTTRIDEIEKLSVYLRYVIQEKFKKITRSIENDWRETENWLDCKLDAELEQLELRASLDKACDADDQEVKEVETPRELQCDEEYIEALRQNVEEDLTSLGMFQSEMSQDVQVCEPKQPKKPKVQHLDLDDEKHWIGLHRFSSDPDLHAEITLQDVIYQARKKGIKKNKHRLDNILLHKKVKNACTENKRRVALTLEEETDPFCKRGAIMRQYKNHSDFGVKDEHRHQLHLKRTKMLQVLKFYENLREGKRRLGNEIFFLFENPLSTASPAWTKMVREGIKNVNVDISKVNVLMLEALMPKFYSLFKKWCLANKCEYFLNQLAPISWRVENDYILHNTVRAKIEAQKSLISNSQENIAYETSMEINVENVSNNLDGETLFQNALEDLQIADKLFPRKPREFMKYKNAMDEDSSIEINVENVYRSFKRDLDKRGSFGPVPKPYFETICQLFRELKQVETDYNTHFRTAINRFGAYYRAEKNRIMNK